MRLAEPICPIACLGRSRTLTSFASNRCGMATFAQAGVSDRDDGAAREPKAAG